MWWSAERTHWRVSLALFVRPEPATGWAQMCPGPGPGSGSGSGSGSGRLSQNGWWMSHLKQIENQAKTHSSACWISASSYQFGSPPLFSTPQRTYPNPEPTPRLRYDARWLLSARTRHSQDGHSPAASHIFSHALANNPRPPMARRPFTNANAL
jgi:hypothetical protein